MRNCRSTVPRLLGAMLMCFCMTFQDRDIVLINVPTLRNGSASAVECEVVLGDTESLALCCHTHHADDPQCIDRSSDTLC